MESSILDEVSLISKGLYGKVSEVVGPESIVKLRRLKNHNYEAFRNCDESMETLIISGSRGEGLEFETSDFDFMCVDRNALVLPRYIPVTDACGRKKNYFTHGN